MTGTTVVVGGSGFLGGRIAAAVVRRGGAVVVTGRSGPSTERAVDRLSASRPAADVRGIVVDLARPESIEVAFDAALPVGTAIDAVVLTAAVARPTSLADLDLGSASEGAVIKTVGYAECVRVLRPRFTERASVVLFGGISRSRPYPGSVLGSAVNAGVSGLMTGLVPELAPHRVNTVHPGFVGDTPRWSSAPPERIPGGTTTPAGRLVTSDEVVEAVEFLLASPAVNGVDLPVDGGFSAV